MWESASATRCSRTIFVSGSCADRVLRAPLEISSTTRAIIFQFHRLIHAFDLPPYSCRQLILYRSSLTNCANLSTNYGQWRPGEPYGSSNNILRGVVRRNPPGLGPQHRYSFVASRQARLGKKVADLSPLPFLVTAPLMIFKRLRRPPHIRAELVSRTRRHLPHHKKQVPAPEALEQRAKEVGL